MSPDPENPQQGKVGDTSAEDAAEAKQDAAAKSAEQPEPVEAEGGTPSAASADEIGRDDERSEAATAAEETGVDKAAADALADAAEEEPLAAPGDDDAAEDADDEPADQQERA